MAQRKSLKPGVCGFMNPVCALEEPSCVEDVDFLSSREMEGGASGHGGDCANQSKLRKINVGRCVGGPCAPNVESCGSSMILYQMTSRAQLVTPSMENVASDVRGHPTTA